MSEPKAMPKINAARRAGQLDLETEESDLTVRDVFIGFAISGILNAGKNDGRPAHQAEYAISVADELMKRR